MNYQDLQNRFTAHSPNCNEDTASVHDAVRNYCLDLAASLNELVPEGREKSLVMTKLEEVMFWANAGIAREPHKSANGLQ